MSLSVNQSSHLNSFIVVGILSSLSNNDKLTVASTEFEIFCKMDLVQSLYPYFFSLGLANLVNFLFSLIFMF